MEMANYLNVLTALATAGVEVQITGHDKVKIGGFYKSDYVDVDFAAGTITARYNEVTRFEGEEDLAFELVSLNNDWHFRSENRHEGWKSKDPAWVTFSKMDF